MNIRFWAACKELLDFAARQPKQYASMMLDKEKGLWSHSYCVTAIEETENGVYMPSISGPTIPLPLFPKLGYKMIPLGKNWSYGVAAIIFAVIEYKKCLQHFSLYGVKL